jgi:hypothetical protein
MTCKPPRIALGLLLLSIAAAFAQSPPASPCASCHQQAKTQPATPMAQAMESVAKCAVLIRNPVLTFVDGPYSFRIERRGDESSYTVSKGSETLTLPIRFAVGSSAAIGQTYILENKGEFYESRVSYFSEIGGLDITIGHSKTPPPDLAQAAGRKLGTDEKLRCFGCHSTGGIEKRDLILEKLTPGVQCSHCHENSETHLYGEVNGETGSFRMKHLSSHSSGEISRFCGQCHRTWEEIAQTGVRDITTLRFQPYRLEGSKCFDEDDARISCIACHDPHLPLETVAEHYDSKCQACHSSAKAKPGMCKVAKTGCTTCHMPKLELPGGHHRFADHRIRIVKKGEKFPG